jgi:UDP-glucose 4-epimerase
VDDLSDAHLKALEQLEPGVRLQLNLGTGKGVSVREIVEACRRVTGHPIPCDVGPRRPGDPPELVADSQLAQRTLNWQPKYLRVEEIVRTAWNWHRSHPHGYAGGGDAAI